jgi:TolB-like protein/tetratricopeptide (TPR) repeat protein
MTGTIDRNAIELELDRVLASRAFARSTRSRDLLRYLVNQHRNPEAGRLKESTIAIEVFKRSASSFDGDSDGIVRVSINRLREHLDRFYSTEADRCHLRFEIPRGSYTPIIRRLQSDGLSSQPTVLILPVVNFTNDADMESLCEGLTDDLIDALAQIPALKVISRTTSFKYKSRAIDIREIARETGAEAILETSLQRVGEQLRLTAQMISAADSTHLWSHAFETDATRRETLQGQLIDIVQRSMRTVKAATPLTEPTLPSSASTEAMLAFQRGSYAYRRDTNEGFIEARRQFELAIASDPQFARAYASLSRSLWAIGNAGIEPLSKCAQLGHAAASKAVALAPTDPFAIAARGHYMLFVDYDPAAAQMYALRAVGYAPHAIEARLFAAKVCAYRGHTAEALVHTAIAKTIDPLSLDPLHAEITALILARRHREALAHINTLLAFEPRSSTACWNRAHVLRQLGEFNAGLESFESTVAKWPDSASYRSMIQSLFTATAGDVAQARALREQSLAVIPWLDDPMTYGTIDAVLGDADGVFRSWEHAVAKRDPYVYLSFHHEEFDRYRADPRFQAITQKIGLDPLSYAST